MKFISIYSIHLDLLDVDVVDEVDVEDAGDGAEVIIEKLRQQISWMKKWTRICAMK